MILAFDTYYFENKAKTVCILFDNWSGENYKFETEIIEQNEEYKPGEFYKRELPCILSLLKKIKIDNIDLIIVDGYVYLDDNLKLGLGGHLYKNLEGNIPIIGVARASLVTYLNTAFAVVLGVIILDEPLTIGIILGLPLVLIGSYFASRKSEVAADA